MVLMYYCNINIFEYLNNSKYIIFNYNTLNNGEIINLVNNFKYINKSNNHMIFFVIIIAIVLIYLFKFSKINISLPWIHS